MGRLFSKKLTRFLLGWVSGFYIYSIISQPKSPIGKKLPEVKIKNFSFLPVVKVSGKEKSYHIHHWMYLTLLYSLYCFLRKNRALLKFTPGFIVGGIIQGLTYKDRFEIVDKSLKDTDSR